jgi:murein DD-endopeptidase MepM/ murein hydrolase activator NlpD
MQLRLYWPVKPFYLNQRFGDNDPCVRDFGLPTQSIVNGADNNTCPTGYDKLYPHFGMSGHNGDDLAAGEQNVYAACDGVVVEKQTVPARGLGLGILTNEAVDLNQFGTHFAKVRYWHLKTMYVEVGQQVKAGDLIGVTDNTGYSSGNHLHFEVQPMDKDAGGHPFLPNLVFTNGTNSVIAGAIDPTPFFVGMYAEDIPRAVSLYTALIPLLQKLIDAMRARSA